MEYIYYFILCQKKPEIVYGVYILLYTMPEEARDSVWSIYTTLYYAKRSQR